jgi:hypothetical protein
LIKTTRRFVSKCLRFIFIHALRKLSAASLRLIPINDASAIFNKRGFYLLKKEYDIPIPDEEDLNDKFYEKYSELAGLDMNDQYVNEYLQNLFPRYLAEFRESFSLHSSSSDLASFHLINGSFMAIDAHVYYAFIRHFKPKKMIEIGAGNSTLLAIAANKKNLQETGTATWLTAIDPFPRPILVNGLPGLSQLIKDKLQNVDLELFNSLESGDILFIDSSHVLREGGDVQMEYCEIIPRLNPGVLVHIHDISLPKSYPKVYFEGQHYFNEQYLLQAFLCFNSRFEVLWPGNYVMLKYPDKVCTVFPEYHEMRKSYPLAEPTSFWIRRKS